MAQRIEDEEYSPLGEHVVEIPARHHADVTPRRSYATLGVAAFLALAGVTIVVGIVEERAARERDERAHRDDLREGWQALSTVAAEGAANDAALQAAAATQPNAQPTVVVMPVQVTPPSAQITVNQPLPTSTAQSQAAQGVPQNGMPASNVATGGVVPTPVPVGGNFAAPATMPAGSTPAAVNGAAVNGAAANGAAVNGAAPPVAGAPVSGSAPSAPVGGVPASSAVQSLPQNASFPATQSCGITSCNAGTVCCNASCGICTPPGVTCSQLQCG